MSGPVVSATITLTDELSPNLIKMFEMMEKMAGESSTMLGETMTKSLGKVNEEFKAITISAKEALNPEIAKAFTAALAQTANETKRVTSGLNEAKGAAHGLRGALKDGLELAKLFAGFEAAHLLKESLGGGAHLEEQKQAYKAIAADNPGEYEAALKNAANVAAQHPNVTMAEVLETQRDIRGLLAIDKNDPRYNPSLAALTNSAATADAALRPFGAKFDAADMKNILKSVEGMAEATNPKFIQGLIESYVKAKQTETTNIDSASFRDFIQNSKLSATALNGDFLTKTLPVLLTMNNASRLGNEIAQMSKSIGGGIMTLQSAKWMEEMGLVGPGGIRHIKGQQNAHVDVKDKALATENPLEWVWKDLMPALGAHGITTEKLKQTLDKEGNVDEEKLKKIGVNLDLMESGLRNTVIDILGHFAANKEAIEQGLKRTGAAPGSSAEDMNDKNPIAAAQRLGSAFKNLGEVLTDPVMPAAAITMNRFAQGLGQFSAALSKWAEEHPYLAAAGSTALIGAAGAGTAVLFTTMFVNNTTATSANTAAVIENTAVLGGRKFLPGTDIPMRMGDAKGPSGSPSEPTPVGFWAKFGTELGADVAIAAAVGVETYLAAKAYGDKYGPSTDLDKIIPFEAHRRVAQIGDFLQDTFNAPQFRSPAEEHDRQDAFNDSIKGEKFGPPVPDGFYDKAPKPDSDDVEDLKAQLAKQNYDQRTDPKTVTVTGTADIAQTIRVEVGLDGKTMALLQKAVSIPLNTGDQGKTVGDTLGARNSPHNR